MNQKGQPKYEDLKATIETELLINVIGVKPQLTGCALETISRMQSIDDRYRAISGLTERRFYSIFYSRIDLSKVLVLGINPGGDPTTWTEELLASRSFYDN